MELNLVSPTNFQSIDVNWLEVQTNQGNFVIKNGHAPMILILAENKEITMGFKDGSTTVMTIYGGILQVERTSLTILLTHE